MDRGQLERPRRISWVWRGSSPETDEVTLGFSESFFTQGSDLKDTLPILFLVSR